VFCVQVSAVPLLVTVVVTEPVVLLFAWVIATSTEPAGGEKEAVVAASTEVALTRVVEEAIASATIHSPLTLWVGIFR
jgi:hypothetical protein